jgi:hypothetical protein
MMRKRWHWIYLKRYPLDKCRRQWRCHSRSDPPSIRLVAKWYWRRKNRLGSDYKRRWTPARTNQVYRQRGMQTWWGRHNRSDISYTRLRCRWKNSHSHTTRAKYRSTDMRSQKDKVSSWCCWTMQRNPLGRQWERRQWSDRRTLPGTSSSSLH